MESSTQSPVSIAPGFYRHFKRNEVYWILGIVYDALDNYKAKVLYTNCNGDEKKFFDREYHNFMETVDGVPRFKKLSAEEESEYLREETNGHKD